jgi:hypothetical protein
MDEVLYEHYKGGKYRLIGVAKHTETDEPLVVYLSLIYGTLWARPMDIFYGTVVVDGVEVPRFKRYANQAETETKE